MNLAGAWLVARRRRSRLVYDAHELYTQFEPDPPRAAHALESWLEGVLARRADAVVTVSDGIARELVERHRLRRKPFVVLNCPAIVHFDDTQGAAPGPVRAIYQSAVGPGRVIDDLLDALESTNCVELTLRVLGADSAALSAQIAHRGLTERVRVEQPAAPGELVCAVRAFHVGLVIDRPLTRNAELALPNKLFEYLMAGLAVVVPRLTELGALVEGERVGLTYEPGRPESLAKALSRLAEDRDLLSRLRRQARAAALDRYNAEAQARILFEAWAS